MSKQTPQKKK